MEIQIAPASYLKSCLQGLIFCSEVFSVLQSIQHSYLHNLGSDYVAVYEMTGCVLWHKR